MNHVCNDEQSEKLKEMLGVFTIYGQYLNDIPQNYHFIMAQELSHEIFTYSLEYTTFYNHEFKRPKENKTLSPSVLLLRDIKTLEKARSLILNQAIEKYFLWGELELSVMPNREEFSKLYFEKMGIYKGSKQIEMIIELKKAKKAFDTYFNLTDMIKDLESKSFNIFNELNYFIPKANKNKIRDILIRIRHEFKLKVSQDEKQLLDNL